MALQILCTLERQPDLSVEQALALYFQHLLGGEQVEDGEAAAEAAADPGETRRFAERLVRGVRGTLAELDGLLMRCSRNWRLERMGWVDRNLLRLASYELRHCADTPARVAINEAIEVAKRFGTAESPAFVNGVLDRVLAELGQKTEHKS